MTISRQNEAGDVPENFGFKRLSPDNWLHVDQAWGRVVMSTSDRAPPNWVGRGPMRGTTAKQCAFNGVQVI